MPLTVDVFPTLHARADARLHEARREHLRRAGRGEAPVERRLRETEAGERDELEESSLERQYARRPGFG